MNDIDNLIAQAKAAGRSLEFSGPQSEDSIQELERALGQPMPPSFRSFLARFGAGGEVGAWLAGIYENQPLMEGVGSVYGETLMARETIRLPHHFVVVYSDPEIQALWCLDTSQTDADSECPVVSVNVQSGSIDNVLARTFGDFFRQYLTIRTQRPGAIL